MTETIEYKSANGYSGMLFGKSSMLIFDPAGKESLHTGTRSINTFEELKEAVDTYPELIGVLAKR